MRPTVGENRVSYNAVAGDSSLPAEGSLALGAASLAGFNAFDDSRTCIARNENRGRNDCAESIQLLCPGTTNHTISRLQPA